MQALHERAGYVAAFATGCATGDGVLAVLGRDSDGERCVRQQGLARSSRGVLFDSFRSPLLAGVRSAGSASQQVLYGAGTYRIDVRIEPQMDSDKVILVGQVLNSADPDERLADVSVTLSKGRKVLAESTTSQFGEFQIECQLYAGYRLVVMLPGNAEVTLPLIDPVFANEAEAPHTDDVNRVRRNLEARKKGTRTNG